MISVEKFGKDHWSTFAYAETCVVDSKGQLSTSRMRCHARRHPGLVSVAGDGSKYPTRLNDGTEVWEHDDWDCLDDLEDVGLLEINGTGINPVIKLTELGYSVAAELRRYKSQGGNFRTFLPKIS